VNQYDFWTITIFTGLGLGLKIVIFSNFFAEVLGPSVARKKIPGQKQLSKFRINPEPYNSIQFLQASTNILNVSVLTLQSDSGTLYISIYLSIFFSLLYLYLDQTNWI
jgi:hypothetical protein